MILRTLSVGLLATLRNTAPVFFLVDVQRFQHSLSEAISQWRDSAIIPRYNAVGIQKMGYIIGPNAQLPPTQDASANPDRRRTVSARLFHPEDEAVTWFKDSE